MLMRKWATRNLVTGDLTALRNVADGSVPARAGQIERLRRRGFVAERADGITAVTVPGRLALIMKSFGNQTRLWS